MGWSDHSFHIPRQSDQTILEAAMRAFSESGIAPNRIEVNSVVGGPAINVNGTDFAANPELAELLAAGGHMLRRIMLRFESNQGMLDIQRPNDQLRDVVHLNVTGIGQETAEMRKKLLSLARLSKVYLKEMTSLDQLKVLGVEVAQHYEVREATVAKLEATLAKLTGDLADAAKTQRRELDAEFAARRDQLEQRAQSERDGLAAQFERRQDELNAREEELKKRLSEVDDRASRHARRKIREDIKQELAKRYLKFELTEGTRKLRAPVFWFAIVLLIVFGVGFVTYSGLAFVQLLNSNLGTPQLIVSAVRQILLGAAFGSTAVFFIRWNNRWFEQHASEEFRLKRLELDLDRASWVVEMGLEWMQEKGEQIPSELLARLTSNLFLHDGQGKDVALHPADQFASLLGASNQAKLDFPGGSLSFDRKGLKALEAKE